MKINWIHIAIFLISSAALAQKSKSKELSLEESIRTAVANNFDLKNQNFQIDLVKSRLAQARKERDPSLSADFSQAFNLGRNIDPFSNQFVTKPINSANVGLNASYTLYDGGIIKNTIQLQETEKQITETEKQRLELELKREVSLAYLEVVLKQQLLRIKEQEKTLTQSQIQRVTEMVRFGNSSSSLLIDLQAQLENDSYALISAEGELELAKRKLLTLMNDNKWQEFTVEEPIVSSKDMKDEEYKAQLRNLPDLQLRQYEINRSDLNIRIAEASKKPQLYLSGGVFSRYSSQASPRTKFLDEDPTPTVQTSETEYVLFNGQPYPLNRIIAIPATETVKFGYFNQLVSNSGFAFSLNMKYPILDKGQRQAQLESARVEKLIAQNKYFQTQASLTNQLKDIVTYIQNSREAYKQALKAESAQEKAFEIARLRFEEGLISFTEFDRSKINLENARSNVLRNKLTHYFYNLLYEYYAY